MAAATDTMPDLWNAEAVRELVLAAVSHENCRAETWDTHACAADAVMEILRDVLGAVGSAQADETARTRQTILRLDAKLCEARAELAELKAGAR